MTEKERRDICRDFSAGFTVALLAEKYHRHNTVIYRALKKGEGDPLYPPAPSTIGGKAGRRAKIDIAQRALAAAHASTQDRDRDAVVKAAIVEFLRAVDGLEVQEVRIRVPARSYEASYIHIEEGRC
jgi:IS30 family transposase